MTRLFLQLHISAHTHTEADPFFLILHITSLCHDQTQIWFLHFLQKYADVSCLYIHLTSVVYHPIYVFICHGLTQTLISIFSLSQLYILRGQRGHCCIAQIAYYSNFGFEVSHQLHIVAYTALKQEADIIKLLTSQLHQLQLICSWHMFKVLQQLSLFRIR